MFRTPHAIIFPTLLPVVALLLSACAGSNPAPVIPGSTNAASAALTSVSSSSRRNNGGGYRIKDLGVLTGDSVSKAYALNATGQVTGVSETPTAAIATSFANGTTVNVNTLNAQVSLGEAIDSSGRVAGYMFLSGGAPAHAFLYSNGTMQDINDSGLFPAGTYGFGINDSGAVVGQGWLSSSGTFHPFLFANGKMSDIGTLGGIQATAYAINDSNQIVGASLNSAEVQHAFLYANGKMSDLGVAPGSIATGAAAINSTGQIAGTIYLNGGGSDAALYSKGRWTDFGNFSGAAGSSATGISKAGRIVGTAKFPNQYHPFKAGKHVALIVESGHLVDLNTLIPPGSGLTVTDALAINDAGQIAADATTSAGSQHAVLLTPK